MGRLLCSPRSVLLLLLALAAAGQDMAASSNGLRLEIQSRQRAYVNEKIPLSVILYSESSSIRNVQYPKIGDSDVSEFATPRTSTTIRDGRELTAYEFKAFLVPSRPGPHRIGPAEITVQTMAAQANSAGGFFGSSEPTPVTIESDPLVVTVVPLPSADRPGDFRGAVGRYTVSRTASPTVINVLEPFTITTRIQGTGNVDAFVCPSIDIAGTRSYPVQATPVRGSLICEQTLIATAGDLTIPGASISFFDPVAARYVTRTSSSVNVRVLANSNSGDATNAPIDAGTAGPPATTGIPDRSWIVGVLVLTLLLGAAAVAGASRPRKAEWLARLEPPDHLEAAAAALAREDQNAFYLAVFRSLQAAIEWHLAASARGKVAAGTDLTPATCEDDTFVQRAKALIAECDAVRYGQRKKDHRDMERALDRLRLLTDDSRRAPSDPRP